VRVLLASEPGVADRPNEDFAAAIPGAAVLLDGAGFPAGTESGCVHGTAWYSRILGGLLAAGATDETASLPEVLGRGIEQVRQMHAGTCDLGHPFTPQATVVMARQRGDLLEYLVLCDSVLLLQPCHGPAQAVTDPRLDAVASRLRAASGLTRATSREDQAWQAYSQQVEATRNQPGGFWLAAADPFAATQAVTGAEPIADLSAAALLSDGATRLADRYHLATWDQLAVILAEYGPAGLICQVRAAEDSDPDRQRWPRGKVRDDATAVYWQLD
jgi:hypothetical protein